MTKHLTFYESFKVGDVIVFAHQRYGQMIKRISEIAGERFKVAGDGASSTPSSDIGLVERRQIEAICIWPK